MHSTQLVPRTLLNKGSERRHNSSEGNKKGVVYLPLQEHRPNKKILRTTVDQVLLRCGNHFPGIHFGIGLQYLYCKDMCRNNFVLPYIPVTATPLRLHLFLVTLHYIKNISWDTSPLHYITMAATPLRVHLFVFTLHYIKNPEGNCFCDVLHYGYMNIAFKVPNFLVRISCGNSWPLLGRAIHGPIPVSRETFDKLSAPLFHTDFPWKQGTKESCDLKSLRTSAVPKRGRSKRGRSQKHANARKRAQMNAKERKRKSANARKRAQKGAKERKRALPRKNCKQPGLKPPGLGTPENRWRFESPMFEAPNDAYNFIAFLSFKSCLHSSPQCGVSHSGSGDAASGGTCVSSASSATPFLRSFGIAP